MRRNRKICKFSPNGNKVTAISHYTELQYCVITLPIGSFHGNANENMFRKCFHKQFFERLLNYTIQNYSLELLHNCVHVYITHTIFNLIFLYRFSRSECSYVIRLLNAKFNTKYRKFDEFQPVLF